MLRYRKSFFTAPVLLLALLALPVLAEVISIAAQEAGFTKHDLAYYLDENLINFVRPGLNVKITGATIESGKITVRFKITDGSTKNVPLDREGVTTPGDVSTSFIAAYIPQGQKLYTAYTTRTQVSPITNKSAVQAGTDSGGTYTKIADGEYTYTFRTLVPATFDPTATHSIGMHSSRNLSEFDLGTQYDDDVYTFVPAGGEVKTVRDVVKTATCNRCHEKMGFHGGSRQSVELCILCHTTQTTDPDTGNSVDMTEMVHKIHMGDDLPSVKAGKPYQIIGYRQAVHDYSTVAFPDQVKRCEACHTGASQASIYLTAPSRRACGSCHDQVNFATGEGHLDLAQVSDNMCSTCHVQQGELEYDASIKGAHVIDQFSTQLPGTTLKIVKVENTGQGQKPTVTFSVKDKKGNVLDASKMDLLNLILAGPTSDINDYKSEDARTATASGDAYVYTFRAAIPENAVASYIISLEGYKNVKVNEGTKKEKTVRDVGYNQMMTASIDGRPVAPRRLVVSDQKCNACHGTLMRHGTIRRSIQYCNVCHNPNLTDSARRPADKMPAQTIHFKTMIHKIHTGEELATDYTVYGRGGPFLANEVRYPADRRACTMCHEGATYQVPIGDGLLSTQAPRDYITVQEPITAACLSCHTQKSTAAHAAVMTSPTLGESCAACHGKGHEFSIDRMHAR